MNAAARAPLGSESDGGLRQALIGSTGHHARVALCTITDKEFPVAYDVLEQLGPLAEVDETGAYTFADCLSMQELPFVLVQAAARTNQFAGTAVETAIREFRPQHFLVTGTAGGIHRPVDDNAETYKWSGPGWGDVMVSEYVHYSPFMKVTNTGYLPRHLLMDQPSIKLITNARAVIQKGSWTHLARAFRGETDADPKAKFEEILSGEAVQDNPLEPMQQFLMWHFDRAGAVEMESAGVAQTIYAARNSVHYAPGFITIRGVSDIVYARGRARELVGPDIPPSTEEKTVERDRWSSPAAATAFAFAVALATRLVKGTQPAQPGHRTIDGFAMPQRTEMSDPSDSLKS
jgi:nucleoside phosphorylase